VDALGGDDAFWWALALGACFGGNATMIAAAANVAAAGLAERAGTPIGFVTFLKVGIPVTIVCFFLHSLLGLAPVVVALGGATAMLLLAADDVEDALSRVEWSTIFFFLGLFVMVGGLEQRGVIGHVANSVASVTGGSAHGEALLILWGSAGGSALVDNIPFTAAMIPVVDHLQVGKFDDANWWALALGACFGGNATLIAAAANVASAGVLERHGEHLSFVRFLWAGIPVTLVSLLIATGYLLLFQL
jgi:Na+/H+ antiporter NhaD/arsenite permease-like protein